MTRSAARRSTVTAPAEVVARDADESLHAGRFKKAAELYKQLLRRESRPEWREHLAEVSRAEQNQATVVPVAESGVATSFMSQRVLYRSCGSLRLTGMGRPDSIWSDPRIRT